LGVADLSKVAFGPFWLMLPGLGPNRQPSISLKFLLEAGLELESFEPLIDFLEFLVQKL